MQERVGLAGGVCFIMSDPGLGTTIHVTVPINKREK
jgi:signal transduction histidine kinase